VSDSPLLDAEVLLSHILGSTRSGLHTRWRDRLDGAHQAQFSALLERRSHGEPIAYITGEREFWSLPLRVTADTLIPRPDTECLVEAVLTRLRPGSGMRVADLGTGSGAIALALASERPDWHILATDISRAALEIAQTNALRLALANVEFRHGDWCRTLEAERFDLIATNPPYVRRGDPHLRRGDLQFEPELALVAGDDGLESLRVIVAEAPLRLKTGGWLVVEHGFEQAAEVRRLYMDGGFTEIASHRDLGGTSRVVSGRWPGKYAVKPAEGMGE
jgi:release factor glutamine methyltransferase